MSGALDRLEALVVDVLVGTYDEPWTWDNEPREDSRPALKSGPHTVLTVGRYFDGGSDEHEAALNLIAACDPATVAALLAVARAAREDLRDHDTDSFYALRDALASLERLLAVGP